MALIVFLLRMRYAGFLSSDLFHEPVESGEIIGCVAAQDPDSD